MLDLSIIPSHFGLFIAIVAVLSVAISKSGFGGALGAIAAPLMLLAFTPTQTLGILLPLFLLIDMWVVWQWRRFAGRRFGLRRIFIYMIAFATIGQLLGWLLLRIGIVDEALLLLFIGAIAVFSAARYFIPMLFGQKSSELLRKRIRDYRRNLLARSSIWCSLSGFSSFVSLTGGIPIQVFLLPLRLPRRMFVATSAWYFLFINSTKVPFFTDLSYINAMSLSLSLVLVPLIPIGVMIGKWLNQKMSDKIFYFIAHILLLLLGLQLLLRYFTGAFSS